MVGLGKDPSSPRGVLFCHSGLMPCKRISQPAFARHPPFLSVSPLGKFLNHHHPPPRPLVHMPMVCQILGRIARKESMHVSQLTQPGRKRGKGKRKKKQTNASGVCVGPGLGLARLQ